MRPVHLLALVCSLTALAASCSATSGGAGGGSGGSSGSGGSGATGGSGGYPEGGSDAPEDGNYQPTDTVTVIGLGADQGSPAAFGGPETPTLAPRIVYPQTGIVVPPNMNSFELHFEPAQGQTLFEFTFLSPTLRYVEYTGCAPLPGGCGYAPSREFWERLAEAAKGGAAVHYWVRGVDRAAPGAVGKSEPQRLWFAAEPINGGIYYWNTGGAIQRYDWGFPLQAAENFIRPGPGVATLCVGCHALSRSGDRMAFGKDFPGLSPYSVIEVATRLPSTTSAGAPIVGNNNAFYSFSPDGNQLLLGNGIDIDQLDISTGTTQQAVLRGTMPDWSPDGTRATYAMSTFNVPIATATAASAHIMLATYQGGRWVNAGPLVPFDGTNNYYPTFAPMDDWIMFNRSPAGNDNFTNAVSDSEAGAPDGQLWVVKAQPGAAPIHLAAATDGQPTSWPKWAPGVYTYDNGRLMLWFTFSSLRPYGLRLGLYERTQLWMAGYDLGRAAEGRDPSFPAFWLPFQDIGGGNHIAQWVTEVKRKPCVESTECEGSEICNAGRCIPDVR